MSYRARKAAPSEATALPTDPMERASKMWSLAECGCDSGWWKKTIVSKSYTSCPNDQCDGNRFYPYLPGQAVSKYHPRGEGPPRPPRANRRKKLDGASSITALEGMSMLPETAAPAGYGMGTRWPMAGTQENYALYELDQTANIWSGEEGGTGLSQRQGTSTSSFDSPVPQSQYPAAARPGSDCSGDSQQTNAQPASVGLGVYQGQLRSDLYKNHEQQSGLRSEFPQLPMANSLQYRDFVLYPRREYNVSSLPLFSPDLASMNALSMGNNNTTQTTFDYVSPDPSSIKAIDGMSYAPYVDWTQTAQPNTSGRYSQDLNLLYPDDGDWMQTAQSSNSFAGIPQDQSHLHTDQESRTYLPLGQPGEGLPLEDDLSVGNPTFEEDPNGDQTSSQPNKWE